MKKILRWLADISGVTEDIKSETAKEIGGVMMGTKYWWNGGSLGKPKWDVANAFHLYAMCLKNGHLYSVPIAGIRQAVYLQGDEAFDNISTDEFDVNQKLY